MSLEGVEPRNSVSLTRQEESGDQEPPTSTQPSQEQGRDTSSQQPEHNQKLDHQDFQELIHEEFGIRAIHSDIFNSGKLVETLGGSKEGLH